MAFLAKVIPWGTHCKLTKNSVMLLLWILTKSVQLKGVRSWIFFMSIEILYNRDHWLLDKTCETRFRSHPRFWFLLSCNFPYQDITITTQFFHLLFGSTLVKVIWLQGVVLEWEKSWVPVWGKGRGGAGDLVDGLMPAEGPEAGSVHLRALPITGLCAL